MHPILWVVIASFLTGAVVGVLVCDLGQAAWDTDHRTYDPRITNLENEQAQQRKNYEHDQRMQDHRHKEPC